MGAKGKPQHKYTVEEVEYLKEIVPGRMFAEVTAMFNEKFGLDCLCESVRGFCKRNGILNGRDSRFKKGNIPANKGKKCPWAWKSAMSRFKKGNIPPNRREIGEERINIDGYVEVKIADGRGVKNWIAKHVHIWQQLNGPVPAGYMVVFIDGDKTNINLDNLMLITRSQNAVLNRLKVRPKEKELLETALLFAELKIKIAERTNKRRVYERKQHNDD